MLLNNIAPGTHLKDFVRFYRIIDFDFTHEPLHSCQVKAYRPRIEHCLQFTPFDCENADYRNGKNFQYKVVLFGQHTELTYRKVGSRFLNFQVVFQPGVLSSVFKISAEKLSNQYIDGELLPGRDIHLINEQLAGCKDYSEMIMVIEEFLTRQFKNTQRKTHPIHQIAGQLLNPFQQNNLDWYANQSNLCYRQFDRAFKSCTGITPKDYQNLVRLDLAYLLKNRFPQKDWFSIAIESGFYDYQHLSRNYKKYTGYAPTQFYLLEQKAPERYFGEFEH